MNRVLDGCSPMDCDSLPTTSTRLERTNGEMPPPTLVSSPKRRRLHSRNCRSPSISFDAPSPGYSSDRSASVMSSTSSAASEIPMGQQAGLIESLTVTNVLCHVRRTIEFQPDTKKMIWIGGNNGSGKSAVFAAINIALGGRASFLDRGEKLRDFVKHGESEAEFEICLRNVGECAYRPDIYGPSIIIRRTVKATGATSLKILNGRTGQIIDHKMEELSRIRDSYSIQIDNPIFWMTQQRSSAFLRDAKPEKLYELFYKATDLERSDQGYVSAEKIIRQLSTLLEGLRIDLKPVKARLIESKKKLEGYIKLDMNKIRQKLNSAYAKSAWFNYDDREKALKQYQTNIQTLTVGRTKQETIKERRNIDLEHCNAERDDLLLKVNDASADGDQKKQHLRLKNNHCDTETSQHDQLLRDLTAKEREIKLCQDAVGVYSKEIERLQQLESSQPEMARNQQKLEQQRQELKSRFTQMEAEDEHLRHRLNDAHELVASCRLQMGTCREDYNRIGNEILEERRDLDRLKSSAVDKSAQFGSDADTLAKLVQQNRGKFRREPLGPLGAYVSVEERRWAPAIEFCLGSLLRCFAVDNFADNRQLQELIAKHRLRVSIITQSLDGPRYDVSRNSASGQGGYATVLDKMTFQNDSVHNIIVDQRGIESVLLIDDAVNARNFMRNCYDRRVSQAFVPSGRQVFPGEKYRDYAVDLPRNPLLTSTTDQQVLHLERSIKDKNAQKVVVERQCLEQKEAFTINEKRLRDFEREQRSHTEQLGRLRAEADSLRRRVEQLVVSSTTDVSQTMNDKLQAERQLETLTAEREKLCGSVKEGEQRMNQAKEQRRAAFDAYEAAKNYAKTLQAHAASIDSRIAEANRDIRSADDKISRTDERLTQWRDQEANIQSELDVLRRGTEMYPERPKIEKGETVDSINAETTHLERKLNAAEQTYGSYPRLKEMHDREQSSYIRIRKEIDDWGKMEKSLTEAMRSRRKRFRFIRNYSAHKHTLQFQRLITKKKFEGKLSYNHETHQLNIQIQVRNDTDADDGGSRPKKLGSLSGGERSYATACFLLSLWDTMNAPFQLVDEFDVFMDATTRRVVDDTVVQFACMTEKQTQHLVFSPHPLDTTHWKGEKQLLKERTLHVELPLSRSD